MAVAFNFALRAMWISGNLYRNLIILAFTVGPGFFLHGQDRCGTIQYTNTLKVKNLIRESDPKFEQWLIRRMQKLDSRVSTATTFKIPVVVHVIHNGEAVGVGANIPDSQIMSQIKVLNNDFRRLNADTTNTPVEFSSVAGRVNIEFVLAKQSPQGVSTNGIIRVKGTKSQWTINDNNTLKALSYWPAENYMNIWVTDIASTILGYAQFPVSDLPGLEDPENYRLTDGVVLDYRIVGSNQDGSFNLTTNFNRGRTATHEVGHFLGLRHIWGDDEGACSGYGDYVEDTPDQGNSSNGCPSHPQISCNTRTMFQNYMDYTNDVCMNLYTRKQAERMLAVLENSPRRTSLLSSNGLYDPAPVANDLALVEIQSPAAHECIGSVVPQIMIKNQGSNEITSARIQMKVGETVIETKDVSLGSLVTGQETKILFSPYALSAGALNFSFHILTTNSRADGKTNDNTKTITTEVPHQLLAPFSESFNIIPASWRILDEDEKITWSAVQTGPVSNVTNSALVMKYFQSSEEEGEKDVIITPVIDLSDAMSPFLGFDVAYEKYLNHTDGLEVRVLLNCQGDLTTSDVIYSKKGAALATVSSTNNSFSPANENQWRREVIDVSAFIGQAYVQFAFVGISDNGNNLYLDNVALRTNLSDNVAITDVTSPSPVQCSNEVSPSVIVVNKSDSPLNSLKVVYFYNEEPPQSIAVAGDFILAPGAQTLITLPLLNLPDGENRISFEITYPNGFKDVDMTDNAVQVTTIVNRDQDKIPLRKNFDNESESEWQIVNPLGGRNWETTSTDYNESLYFRGDSTSGNSQHSWFVSPILDLSKATTASLFFDLSHSSSSMDVNKDPAREIFRVLASRDCGKTFDEVLFAGDENSLPEGTRQRDAIPASANDWNRIYINLNSLAGEEGVRIAFVVSTAVSNSVFVDNIEFFLSDDPSPPATSELYAVYPNRLQNEKSFYVTFNLPARQSVAYELVDMLGKQVGAKELSDVLNQTYKIDVENASNGIYLVRLLIDKKHYVSRILVYQ